MAEVKPVVRSTTAKDLEGPLKLLEKSLRDGPLPRKFVALLREEVERGNIELLAAYVDEAKAEAVIGVVVLAFRPSIFAGDYFASIEDLYVTPENRRRGVGRALLETAERQCASKNISYIEVQTVEEDAAMFYQALGYELESGVRVLSWSMVLREAGD